jgi:hypothetical protein
MPAPQRFFKQSAGVPLEYREGQCRQRTGRADDAPSCDPAIFQDLADHRKAQGRLGSVNARSPMMGSGIGEEGIVPSVVGRVGFYGNPTMPRELYRPYADVLEEADQTIFQKPLLQAPTGYDEMIRRTIEDNIRDKRFGNLLDRTDEGYSTGNEVVYAPRRPLYPIINVPTNKPQPCQNFSGIPSPLTNQAFAQSVVEGQEQPLRNLQRRGGFDAGANQTKPINGGTIAPQPATQTDCNRKLNLRYTGPRDYAGGWARLKQSQTELAFENLGLLLEGSTIKSSHRLFEEGRATQVFTDEGDAADRYWTKRAFSEWGQSAATKEGLQLPVDRVTSPALLKQQQANGRQTWRDVGWSPIGTGQARLDVGEIVRDTQGGIEGRGMNDLAFYSTMHFGGSGLGQACGRALF